MIRTRTSFLCSSARSFRMNRRKSTISSRTSAGGRSQFSELKEKIVRIRMPSSPAARTVRRSASTPRRCPSLRGSPRAAAQRPLPSMMMATCRGAPKRAVREVGALASGMKFRASPCSLDGQDFLFLHRERAVDFGNGLIGRLLDLIGIAIMVVLADLVVFFQFLESVEGIPSRVPYRHACGFGVSVRHFDEFLASLLVELWDAKPQHLAFGRRIEPEIGIDDGTLYRGYHRFVPHLNGEEARLRHADRRQLIERHMGAVGLDVNGFEQARRGAAGPQSPELLFEHVDRALHSPFELGEVVCRGCHWCLSNQSVRPCRDRALEPAKITAAAVSRRALRVPFPPARPRSRRARGWRRR